MREVRLMQGLAQQVTALRPELVNAEATLGELARGLYRDVGFRAFTRELPHVKPAT